MHKRNKHNGSYDFEKLVKAHPALKAFVQKNKYDKFSINFFDAKAVLALNTALLKHHYKLSFWQLPKQYLCPPIPGRANYIHHVADLLSKDLRGKIPKGDKVKCLDIGVGANCIYPLIGTQSYAWTFVGTDIDQLALANAQNIISNNDLEHNISLRHQHQTKHFFKGIVKEGEIYALSICNPPFHGSAKEAAIHNVRKNKNLKGKNIPETQLNFGGQSHELWCQGGEKWFIRQMIRESESFKQSCIWFTTLVSKESNLKSIENELSDSSALDFRLIPMELGNKKSRIVAWTFYSDKLRNAYLESLG